MRLQRIVLTGIFFIAPLALAADDLGKLRAIDAKGLKVDFAKGRVSEPRVFTSVDEFDKAFPKAGAVKKQVDFTKEKLVFFAWGGSGQDRLAGKLSEDGKTAAFAYTRGRTRDFRRHVQLFAVPKNAVVKVQTVR
ncbi:MAG: hypothetical protein HYX68_11810 [Planctomycetes bacterium]|nr:hypothetical protein [Planctomycetota bacterium]